MLGTQTLFGWYSLWIIIQYKLPDFVKMANNLLPVGEMAVAFPSPLFQRTVDIDFPGTGFLRGLEGRNPWWKS